MIKKVKDIEVQIRSIDRTLQNDKKGSRKKERLREQLKEKENELQKAKNLMEIHTKKTLSEADVVLGTIVGCSENGPLKLLAKEHFQLLVVDECSQALEMACWTVIPRAQKLVIAGDYHQLAPTIFTKLHRQELSISLLERLIKYSKQLKSSKTMLTIQYRMNEKIMKWSSVTFYRNQVKASPDVVKQKLADLNHVKDCDLTNTVLLLLDIATSGKVMFEHRPTKQGCRSFANLWEASLVICHVDMLVKEGVLPDEIGIITPYSLQVSKRHSIHAISSMHSRWSCCSLTYGQDLKS